nr:reverse transcriptase domain-containing protein [Tanacetum cinerariifolium]
MITLSEGHKNSLVSDLLIDFQIKFSLSISGIVTHWFTLIVLSALRRSDNENMLSLVILILRYDEDECDKGRMHTKIELTQKQSQQGASNDVLMEILLEPTSNKLLVAPIAPPLSSVLSSQFDSREYFLPKEILLPWKRARFLSHSSANLAAPPKIFEIGESSHKMPLEWHKEHIETILNHLDELPLERIEEMEDKIRGLGNEWLPRGHQNPQAPAMTQAAIRKLVADSVATALEVQAANMANADNTNRNTEPREAHVERNYCTEDCKVKFATGTLIEEALSWWNSFAQPIRIEEAYKVTWLKFKKLSIVLEPRSRKWKMDFII